MNAKPPSDQAEKIVVRLPDGMRQRLAEIAKANSRSVNAEVVDRLEKSFIPAVLTQVGSAEEFKESMIVFADLLQKIATEPKVLSSILTLDLSKIRK